MHETPIKCATPTCPNTTHHLLCLSCSALEVSRKLFEATEGVCTHAHSITGDHGMVMRMLPEYKGGRPQPGYMLDVCKMCMQELQERPYVPISKHVRVSHKVIGTLAPVAKEISTQEEVRSYVSK